MSDAEREWPTLPYAAMLRALGQHLDAIGASNVLIVDIARGFVVRYSNEHVGQSHDMAFTYDQLSGLEKKLPEMRTRNRPTRSHQPPRAGGYQDLLRSIGLKLEDSGYSLVVLDEQAAGYTLSYMYSDSARALYPVKGFMEFSRDEVGKFQESSFQRRSSQSEKTRAWKRILG
jgi:hypothetical protein